MKDSLSAPDLASLLGITDRTLRRWVEDGTGPKRVVEKLGAAARIIDAAGRLALLQAWERRLCSRYKLKSTEVLYEAIRHSDFHETGKGAGQSDKIEHWRPACYAAFS